MADAESGPATESAKSARHARSNYVLYLVATGLVIVANALIDEPSDASNWGVPIVGSLLLLSIIVLIIAVVRAYGDRKKADEKIAAHFRLQIRTFWISWLYGGVNALIFLVSAEFFSLPELVIVASDMAAYAIHIWFVIRCVKGLRYLSRQEPYPNPGTWLW